jgi:hypothetical protein
MGEGRGHDFIDITGVNTRCRKGSFDILRLAPNSVPGLKNEAWIIGPERGQIQNSNSI